MNRSMACDRLLERVEVWVEKVWERFGKGSKRFDAVRERLSLESVWEIVQKVLSGTKL